MMPAVDEQPALLTAALNYAAGGLDVFPLHSITLNGDCTCGHHPCGSPGKHPRTRVGVHDATDDADAIREWWARWPGANVGVATDAPGLYVIDIDGPTGADAWEALCRAHDGEPSTRSVRTGNGRHLWYVTDVELGNTASKIARSVDSRGRGGYVVAPPSVHAAGTTYAWENPGSPLAKLPEWLVLLATKPDPAKPPIGTGYAGVTAGTGDELARRRLEGACGKVAIAAEGERNTVLNWAAHAAGRLIGAERLDRGDVEQALTLAGQRAGLAPTEIAGTIRSGIEAGRNNPDHQQPGTDSTDALPTPLVITTPDGPGTSHNGPETSWAPVDGTDYINGTWTPPEPTQLARDDGTCLFYAGRINLLFGESEAGKGWVVLHAVAQAIDRDHQVLYIDFEDYPDTIYARLKLLGTTPTGLADRFAYIRPDAALDDPGRKALSDTIVKLAPHLVILDGVTGAMSLHGLDTNSSTDVDQFYSLLGEPLARTGAAVVFIDHVTKSSETRGKGPIGSQHKRARVSGASYEVSSVQPIAPGRSGKLRLKIDKDRLGAVRSTHPMVGGDFVLDSTDPDRTHAKVYAPTVIGTDPFRPTHAMESVSRALEAAGDKGLSRRAIEESGGFSKDVLWKAVEALVEEGYAGRAPGPRNTLIHKLTRPFEASGAVPNVTTVPGTSPGVPDSSGTVVGPPAERPVPTVPRLTKAGTGDGRESADQNDNREVPL